MRQSLLSRLAKRTLRQGQIGQTIVIMAFGFIILLAFVGIVTDVSLMFVRFSQLTHAPALHRTINRIPFDRRSTALNPMRPYSALLSSGRPRT